MTNLGNCLIYDVTIYRCNPLGGQPGTKSITRKANLFEFGDLTVEQNNTTSHEHIFDLLSG